MKKPFLPPVFAVLFLLACPLYAMALDARQKIDMPEMMREHMLGNMRDHLQALQEIQGALARNEFGRAADIAEQRIGMSSLETHGATHMAPYMPKPMQDIGTEMHRAASRFARTAQEASVKGDMSTVFEAYSRILQQCVACHSAYKVK